jgi:hypothetical protein
MSIDLRRGGPGEATWSRRVWWASLIVAAVGCTPNVPRPEEAPVLPVNVPAPAEADNPLGLVGCSKGCGDPVKRTAPDTYTKLRAMDDQMAACSERSGPHSWQVHYTVPGFAEPWRRTVISGGAKVKQCLERTIAAIAWPEGWSAKIVAWEEPVDVPPDDPELAAVHFLIEKFAACTGGEGGKHELDALIEDESGSTMTTGSYVGDAACFRKAIAGYVAPAGWRTEFTVKPLP